MNRRPSVVRVLFLAMMGTGLAMGLVFPLVVSPFADYRPGLRFAFAMLCVVAGLVVGGLNFLLVRRFLLRPVDLVSGQLRALTGGQGISASRLVLDSDDALGRLVEQFNALIELLRGTLLQVIETVQAFVDHADETGRTAHELAASVDRKSEVIAGTAQIFSDLHGELARIGTVIGRLEASAGESRTAVRDQVRQIASVNDQIARLQDRSVASAEAMDRAGIALQRTSGATGELTQALEGAATSMTEMDATLREIDRSLKEAAAHSESVTAAAGAGARAVASTREGMARIHESATAAATAIAELNRHVERIGMITAVIDDVTEQTGLLALNAAIIAAQAGEHGRGFAVVADEIRALATRTADSTREIDAIVAALRTHADASLASMGQSRAQVEAGVSLSGRAAEALGSIQDSAANSLQRMRAISRSIGEITSTSHTLSGNVDAIAGRAREIAAATAAQDQEVAALRGMAQADVEATAALAALTREQQHAARRLEQQADEVAGLVASSSEALRSGRGQTDMLAATIETLQVLDTREREHFGRCETDAERLTARAQSLRRDIERLRPAGDGT